MTIRSKFNSGILILLLSLLVTSCSIETTSDDTGKIQLTRQEIQLNRQRIVSNYISLTSTEGKNFWPIYHNYREEIREPSNQWIQLTREIARCCRTNYLTDLQVFDRMNKILALQQQRLDIQQKYAPQFSRVLSGKKLARLYQIENKMDAVMAYELKGSVEVTD